MGKIIFSLPKELELYQLDYWEPLHNMELPYVDIISRFGLKELFWYSQSIWWVYLKTGEFAIKTKRGWYLAEVISPNIGIVGDNILKLLRKDNDKVIIKSNFIAGEHFKVKLNFDDFEDDISKALINFMTEEDDWWVIANLNDIYKIGLKELYSMQYFINFPKLDNFEIILLFQGWWCQYSYNFI